MIKSMTFNLTSPIPFDNMEISLRELTLLTGTNGTGKTFMMVNTFCMSFVANSISNGSDTKEVAQFVFVHSFSDQNIHGTIRTDFKDCYLTVTFDKGQVTDIEHNITDQVIPLSVYMSSAMRKFDSISVYLKIRRRIEDMKRIGIRGKMVHPLLINEMVKDFKLYDIVYIERLIKACPITISDQMLNSLETFGIRDILVTVDVDLGKCEFIVATNNGIKNLSNYSAGEQAIINMMLAPLTS